MLNLAEREGFEPSVPRKVQQISSLPRSTTPASLRLSWIINLQCFALPYNRFHSLLPCSSPFRQLNCPNLHPKGSVQYPLEGCRLSASRQICRFYPSIPLIHEFHPFGAIATRCSQNCRSMFWTSRYAWWPERWATRMWRINSFQMNLSTTPTSLIWEWS